MIITAVHPDITAISTFHTIPAVGVLTINSFVLDAQQQMIIDTGTTSDRGRMGAAIAEQVDPDRLRWLWVTHTDADHIGGVHDLLAAYPAITVVTTYTGWIKLSTHAPVNPKRIRLIQPGGTLDLGDRVITAITPPLFDAPETIGFFDPVSKALFSSDCFGAILPDGATSLDQLDDAAVLDAQTLWTSIDTPWVTKIDRRLLAEELDALSQLGPTSILSGHLPATAGIVDQQLDGIRAARDRSPFAGLSHEQLVEMLER